MNYKMKAADLNSNEYASYYEHYIRQSGNNNLLENMKESSRALNSLFDGISDDKMNYKYADDKMDHQRNVIAYNRC